MTQRERNGLVDILRLVGALGIVWFHTVHLGRWISYAALPMFIALLIVLQGEAQDFHAMLRNRARRLLWPWVLWSAFYLLLWGIACLHGGEAPKLHWTMLLTGPVLPSGFCPLPLSAPA